MGTKSLAAWTKDAKALCKKLGKKCEIADEATVADVEKYCEALQVELDKESAELKATSEAKNPGSEFEYSIAPGKAITCAGARKGMLHAGQEVNSDMVSVSDLKRLVKCGVVLHNPRSAKK